MLISKIWLEMRNLLMGLVLDKLPIIQYLRIKNIKKNKIKKIKFNKKQKIQLIKKRILWFNLKGVKVIWIYYKMVENQKKKNCLNFLKKIKVKKKLIK